MINPVAFLRPLTFFLLLLLGGLFGGLVGVMMIVAMTYISYKRWFEDRADKHGISERNSSRFGGVLVFFGAIAFVLFCWQFLNKELALADSFRPSQYFRGYEWVALAAGLVGLWEDFFERLSAMSRLLFLFVLVGLFFWTNPHLLPTNVFPEPMPQILNLQTILWLGVTICVVGFINAGNIADGANGLLSNIAMVVFLVAYMQTGAVFYFALIASIFVFTAFNMTTGLMFLGDFGSYSISALMALVCVDLYSQGGSSVWFYGCLLSYPCVELVRVMFLRWRSGSSPMKADNNHLHNRVFTKFKAMGFSSLVANSYTGLALSLLSALVPLVIYLTGYLALDSSAWAGVFLIYCLVHVLLSTKMTVRLD